MGNQADYSAVIALAYLLGAAATLLASGFCRELGERTFWAASAVTLFALSAAKQFQIQGLAMNWVRMEAKAYHLYDQRKFAEYPFLALVIGVALLVGWRSRRWLSRCEPTVAVAASAWLALIPFLLVRAASVHAIDQLMYRPLLGLCVGCWIELTFLLVIAGAALASIGQRNAS